jgi:hypothetical protein
LLLPPAPSSPPVLLCLPEPCKSATATAPPDGWSGSASRVHPTMMSAAWGTYIWMQQHQQHCRPYSTGSALSAAAQQGISGTTPVWHQQGISSRASACISMHQRASACYNMQRAKSPLAMLIRGSHATRTQQQSRRTHQRPQALCSLLLVRCHTAACQ